MLVEAGRAALPFTLTPGQDAALAHIRAQLRAPAPMMCLLQARCPPKPSPPQKLQINWHDSTMGGKVRLRQGTPLAWPWLFLVPNEPGMSAVADCVSTGLSCDLSSAVWAHSSLHEAGA